MNNNVCTSQYLSERGTGLISVNRRALLYERSLGKDFFAKQDKKKHVA